MTVDRKTLSAAVLAGGKSSRMGKDKAFLPLVDEGPPMLATVIERIREVADDVMIVANDRPRFEDFGVRVVPDLEAGAGALGGIHAALCHAAREHCLLVACDMPFLSRALLRRMVEEPRDYDVLAPRLPGESRQGNDGLVYQTLHAIYGRACIEPIARQLAAGNRQVIGFFSVVRLRTIEVDEVRRWDPDLRSFFNANTPEAYASARAIAASWEP